MRTTARWQVALIAAALAGSAAGAESAATRAVSNSATVQQSATVHFDAGRHSVSLRLREPAGVILLYRLSVPRGATVRASTQLPHITVPLRIATAPAGPSSACTNVASRVACTVGEEWCPMPAGTWHVRIEKLGGPPGDVTVWFRIGKPPHK